jgi:LmbE family N-acetylglucosaminyl deacetylase
VYSPYWVDAHPDHVAAVELIEAARFWSKLTKTDLAGTPHHPARILYYNCVHLRVVEKPAFVLDISDLWEQKLASILCYRSQFITGRPTESPTFIDRLRDQAAYWGWSIGTAYGEPFASREPVGIASMRDLV